MSKDNSVHQMRVPEDEDGDWIYSRTIRLRNGRVLHAHQYGLKAFRFRAKRKS